MAEVRRFPRLEVVVDRLAEGVRERIADLAAQLMPNERLVIRADHDDDCDCVAYSLDHPCTCTPEVVVGVEFVTYLPPWVGERTRATAAPPAGPSYDDPFAS
jgi:hypothetical protein